jgi:hypothetical protein
MRSARAGSSQRLEVGSEIMLARRTRTWLRRNVDGEFVVISAKEERRMKVIIVPRGVKKDCGKATFSPDVLTWLMKDFQRYEMCFCPRCSGLTVSDGTSVSPTVCMYVCLTRSSTTSNKARNASHPPCVHRRYAIQYNAPWPRMHKAWYH